MAKGQNNSPEFRKNSGRWDKKLASEAGLKGAVTKRANAEARKAIYDKPAFLNSAVQAVIDKDGDVLAKIMQNVATMAQGDDKNALQAASIFMEYSGLKAPKQQEVKVEEKRESIDEVQEALENLGVRMVIDNVRK